MSIEWVVPKLCGAKLLRFSPQNPDKNLCPLAKGWGRGKSFIDYLDTHKATVIALEVRSQKE